MSISIFRNETAVCQAAAVMVSAHIMEHPRAKVALEWSEALLPVFHTLMEMSSDGLIDWSRVTFIDLSDGIGVSSQTSRSIKNDFFACTEVFRQQILSPDLTLTPEDSAAEYEQRLSACGGIDLALIGLDHGSTLSDTPECSFRRWEDGTFTVRAGYKHILCAGKVIAPGAGSLMRSAAEKIAMRAIDPLDWRSMLQINRNVYILLDNEAVQGL